MHQRLSAFLLSCITLALSAAAHAYQPPATSENGDADEFAEAALKPFWRARQMRESLFFIQHDANASPQAALLFKPAKILRVASATRDTTFEAGRDYVFDETSRTLRLPKGSRIPFKTLDELYPLLTSDSPKIRGKRDDPERGIFWGEGALYHGLQVEATYTCDGGEWKGYVPRFSAETLPRTLKKLRNKEPIKILHSGDSISEGYNASQFTKAKPGCPPFGELVARGLERAYGSKITFENHAHAGWRSDQGLKQAADERLGGKKPDVVIIAFGMNDVGAKDAVAYQKNIRGIMDAIRRDSPDTEFILVSSMLGNAEWGMPMEQFPLHRDALSELCGEGVALADVTAIWQELLKRKSFYDLTGNGVNHPNDFGHLIYAQVILSLLVEPDSNPGELLKRSRRIVFLGDSITHAGQYVANFDAWLLTQALEELPVVIDAGLPSETVSGLSEEGHAGGAFPRPDLAERLDRVLEVAKPDLVFACYGINCGIYEPFDENRFERFQQGIGHLKRQVEAAGATLVLITPPFFDDQRARKSFSYNAVLDSYTEWLLAQREKGWLVVDLHGPMTSEVAKRRKTDPDFTFQPDAVHPNAEGHWFITGQLIRWFGDEAAGAADSPEKLLAASGISTDALELVQQRVSVLRDAYVAAAGHKRPGIQPGLPIPEAEEKSDELLMKIKSLQTP